MKSIVKLIILSFVYVVIVTVVTGILMACGFIFPELKVDTSISFLQLIISSIISSVFVGFVIHKYSQIKRVHFFITIVSILFLSNLSVALEGNIFTPNYITNSVLLSLFLQQLVVASLFSGVALFVFRKRFTNDNTQLDGINRLNLRFGLKIILGSLVYMIMYYVWGWLNYNLLTKPFYDLGISGLDIPTTPTLLKYIFTRGILITLSVVPFLLFAVPESKNKMIETGLILFVFGGLIPLSMTVGMFPVDFALYSLGEIFLQNFITGIVIYKILEPDLGQNVDNVK